MQNVLIFFKIIFISDSSSFGGKGLRSCWAEWSDGFVWSYVYPVQYLHGTGIDTF